MTDPAPIRDGDGRLIVARADFACSVIGTPAAQGSKKHVGGGKMVESSKAVEPWRQDVVKAARQVIDSHNAVFHERHDLQQRPITSLSDRPYVALDGPLGVYLAFTLRKPASAPKRRRTWPDRKPDIDKMVRSTFDALTTAGVWTDDARVVLLTAEKCFPGEHPLALSAPGCQISVWRVDAEQ